jgi:hypothetical protein
VAPVEAEAADAVPADLPSLHLALMALHLELASPRLHKSRLPRSRLDLAILLFMLAAPLRRA